MHALYDANTSYILMLPVYTKAVHKSHESRMRLCPWQGFAVLVFAPPGTRWNSVGLEFRKGDQPRWHNSHFAATRVLVVHS